MTNDKYRRVHAALAPASAVLLDRGLMRGVTAKGSIHVIKRANAVALILGGFKLATGPAKLSEGLVRAQACRGAASAIREAAA